MSVIGPNETPLMKEIVLRKLDIEDKLSEDIRKRELIRKNLERSDQLTGKMVKTLNNFSERLVKLENTILPVHRETKDMQRLQDNVDKTISALDHVIGYHCVANEVSSVIQKQVSSVKNYITCMKKLQEAKEFFSENSPGSPELNTVTSLYAKGNESLETEFSGCLKRHTRDIPAEELLDLVNKNQSEVPVFLPENVIENLSLIAKWLSSIGRNKSFTESYISIRRSHLINSRKTVQFHVEEGPNSKAGVGVSTPKRTQSKAKTSNIRKMSKMLQKETLPTNVGGNLTVIGEDIQEIETDSFVKQASVCLRLLYSENKLMQLIVPANYHKQVFSGTVHMPMNDIEAAFNKFHSFASRCTESSRHHLIIDVFPIAHYLKKEAGSYREILREADDHNKEKIPHLLGRLHETGKNVLEEFINYVKTGGHQKDTANMPKDGTVHELTSNTMMFVQHLAGNADVAGDMLSSVKFGKPDADPKLELAKYLSNILAALKLNLENKSRNYSNDSLKAIFLVNNYTFMITALKRENQLSLIRKATATIDSLYDGFVMSEKNSYMQPWEKLAVSVASHQEFVVQPAAKLKDKEKQYVKDKFKMFNDGFEKLVADQQMWAIPSTEIKAEVREAIRALLLQPFSEMYDRFRKVQFTKNIEKYLKYSPEAVSSEVDKLFSQVAN